MAVMNDSGKRAPRLLQIGSWTIQQTQRRLGIRDHRGDGLVYFVGNRSREPPYCCDPVRVRELGKRPALVPFNVAVAGGVRRRQLM
jgi:hypothetical protein